MKLPFLQKKETVREYFLVLLLTTGKISALLFEKSGEKLTVLAKNEESIASPLDTLESNKLIEASDIVISDVESTLPQGSHLEKTIFSVPQRWVEEGRIKKEHLVSLKRICESLELTPVGFIVSIEALSSHLHKIEGAPVTAIFIELGEKHVTVSIVKNGSLMFVEEKIIQEDAVRAVEEILLTQTVTEVLPAKIILLNYDKATSVQQEFLTYSWSKKLPFLHIPQVSILDPNIESEAVISGVAGQMGFETVEGLSISNPVSTVTATHESEGAGEKFDESTREDEQAINIKEGTSGDFEFNGEEIGFFKDTDVGKKLASGSHEDSNVEPVINDRRDEQFESDEDVKTAVPMTAMASGFISKLKFFKTPDLNIGISGNKLYLYPIFAVILFVILGVLYYFNFEKATVTLYLDKNVITKDMPITFSTKEASSVENGILKLETREITIEGDDSKKATGTKKTGEKAKGEVTIYNKTENKKILPKSSVLVGPNNLTFTLTDEVSIASTSSFSTSFSNAKGKVESADFGKEYNLPSGTNFSLENTSTSEIFAKNESAFSGGTSKDITVVSKEDITSLTDSLVARLTKDAIVKAGSEKNEDEDILENPINYSFEDRTFSKKEGDEASDVRLTGVIVFEIGVYKRTDLLTLAKDATRDQAGEGEFSEDESKVSVKDIKEDDGITTATFVFSSVYLPKIETTDLAGKITGKNSDKAYEILGLDGVEDVKVEFTRSIPFLPKILPFNKNNITIELQANP